MKDTSLISVVDEFDAAWNAHDVDAIMRYIGDDSVVTFTPPPPGDSGVYRGQDEIRRFVETHLPGFHVDSRSHQVVGDSVSWLATVAADSFRRMGLDQVVFDCTAAIRGDTITSFAVTMTPETLARLQASQETAARA
jgi:hypothetical protein